MCVYVCIYIIIYMYIRIMGGCLKIRDPKKRGVQYETGLIRMIWEVAPFQEVS